MRYYNFFLGDVLVGSTWADNVVTMPLLPADAYCKTFGHRFQQNGLTVATIWSELSWRVA